jgi:hypothetical protein
MECRGSEAIFQFADNVPLLVALNLAGIPKKLRVIASLRTEGECNAVRGLPSSLDLRVQDPEETDFIDVDAEHLVKGVNATAYNLHFSSRRGNSEMPVGNAGQVQGVGY